MASGNTDSEAAQPAETTGGTPPEAAAEVAKPWDEPFTRQGLLKTGAAAAAAGGVAATFGGSTVARAAGGGNNKWKNVVFKGYVRHDSTGDVVDLKLYWPPLPRQVVVVTEATQCCYTVAAGAIADTPQANPTVPGHGGVGIVVWVGDEVRRVQVGDRVIRGVTPQCLSCYNCLRGRADLCSFQGRIGNQPAFVMNDGRTVGGGGSGFSELMVDFEEWFVPIWTDHSQTPQQLAEVSLLSCVGTTGLGPPVSFSSNVDQNNPIQGSDVCVMGLGPIGLSMVSGAALSGAGQIIGVDPIKYRRDIALEIGATTVIDPTGKDTTLVNEIRELCKGPTDRYFAGGKPWAGAAGLNGTVGRGPDFVFEATGGQRSVPTVEPQPDPTGILPLQQCYDMSTSYGIMTTVSVAQTGNVSFPASAWAGLNSRTHKCAQYGGADLMKDVPRYVKLLERGLYRADKIATMVTDLAHTRDAMKASADRSTVSAHVVFDASKYTHLA